MPYIFCERVFNIIYFFPTKKKIYKVLGSLIELKSLLNVSSAYIINFFKKELKKMKPNIKIIIN